MIKIQSVMRELVFKDIEAYTALTEGYMNMSSYAYRVKPKVELLTKKQISIASLVVTLSRLRKEFKKEKPLIHEVRLKNITTKLPLSEIVYENSAGLITELETLHKNISVSQEDFFTTTIGTTEIDIMCSANLESKVLKHFKAKPKIINHSLAAVGISFNPEVFSTPNTFFSLLAVTARARVNIEELISTPTELIFIVAEKDFAKTVSLFSELHKETNSNKH